MNIAPNGSWLCETKEPHGFDEPLARAIVLQLKEWNVIEVADFGCGSGAYVDYLNREGITASGYDGNPNTRKFGGSLCHVQDLSVPFDAGACDTVLSLEVGEHIPQQFEGVFLDNITKHAMRYVILSWFPRPGEGIGHVNERSNDYVKEQMAARGFKSLDNVAAKLREASSLWWFKESTMAFQRA